MKYIFLPFLIFLFFTACSSKQNLQLNTKIKEDKLYNLILTISSNIDKKEAFEVSKDLISQSTYLAKEYGVNTSALFHNTLINLELKSRGYCYHYALDLREFLKTKKYKSFKIKVIVSKRGEYFEHTALLLTRNDIKFEDSIVLDAWRNTGDLYFSKVKGDKSYIWEIR